MANELAGIESLTQLVEMSKVVVNLYINDNVYMYIYQNKDQFSIIQVFLSSLIQVDLVFTE